MRSDTGGHHPTDFVHQTRCQHVVHALRDATMQHFPGQGQLNVPRTHGSGLARVRLPPGQPAPREQRDFDGAGRPLPPTAGEPPVEPCRPVRQVHRREPRRPIAQALAPDSIERRLPEQTVGQCANVQAGATDHDGLPRGGTNLLEPPCRVAREAAGTVALPRGDHVEAQVRHACEQCGSRLRGAHVQLAIHLARVGGHDRDRFERGPCRHHGGLADGGGADNDRCQASGVRSAQIGAPALPSAVARPLVARGRRARAG